MTRRSGAWGWWLAGLLFVVALALGLRSWLAPESEPEERVAPLVTSEIWRPGEVRTGSLAPGAVTELPLDLAAGQFLDLVVEQHESDLKVQLVGPRGGVVARADRPLGHTGPERLVAWAKDTGIHRLVLRATSGTCGGRWSARLDPPRQATAEDHSRAEIAGRLARARDLRRQEEWDAARSTLLEALELLEHLEDREGQVEVQNLLGFVAREAGDPETAVGHGTRAIEVAETLGDPFWSLVAHSGRGATWLDSDRPNQAHPDYQRVLELARRLGDRRQEAAALRHLAKVAQRRGRLQKSLDLYRQAMDLLRPCDAQDRALTQSDLGTLLARALGQPEPALVHFESALRFYEARNIRVRQAITHNQLGQALMDLGRFREARGSFETSVELRSEIGQLCKVATTRAHLAKLTQLEGRSEQARDLIGEVLEEAEESGCADVAMLHRAANLLLEAGDFEIAEARYREALATYERHDDSTRRALALAGLARALDAQGRQAAAVRDSRLAVEEIERVRASVERNDQRIAYFATAQEVYGVAIDLAMASGDWHGGFEVAEQARARALKDRWLELSRDPSPLPGEPTSEILELRQRRSALVAELNGNVYRWREGEFVRSPGTRGNDPVDDGELLESRIVWLEQRIAEIDGDLQRLDPRRVALTGHRTADLESIQKTLDLDTAMLAYRLGDRVSHLWLLDSDGLSAWTLPPASALEALAEEALASLRRPGSGAWDAEPLCALGDALLGPAAPLDRRRLVVIPDGILTEVPWGALPDPAEPCASASPLLTRHTFVTLPGATLATLFDGAQGRRRGDLESWLAVVADPVFGNADDRLEGASRSGTAGQRAWPRLVGTAEEAEAILTGVPPERGELWLGFEASRHHLLAPRDGGGSTLAGSRVLHFATHGVFDGRRPMASYLVLAQRDAEGRPLDGRLDASEIAQLDLGAELAVLSVCRSGEGRQVPGEGAIGLARGFFQAGVGRVLASLWDVDDRSATALMAPFYRELFANGAPDEALRRAQEARWREGCSPAEWAGFQLQGDWRPMAPFAP